MAKDQMTYLSMRNCCYILAFLSSFSTIMFLYISNFSILCSPHVQTKAYVDQQNQPFNLLTFPSAWNSLRFSPEPPPRLLKIALFVKKWPEKYHAGGLERHALTLHLALAKRGHEVHVFTPRFFNISSPVEKLFFHLSTPTEAGYLNQAAAWKQFQAQNYSGKPFDVIHTESVGLMHTRSRNLTNVVVSWHGIAYESIHSDIIEELLRTSPDVNRSSLLTERVLKVVEEIKFFPHYAHHVATSDHCADILKRIYMIPEERVHIILNGVDEDIFKPEPNSDGDFKLRFGIGKSKSLVLGIAGRLVKDKGHPLIFEALDQIFKENSTFGNTVFVLIAGDGPWGKRYESLGSNIRVLGPLERTQLARFYNAVDIFVNPTLRAQGLDHTSLEAMLVGKPLIATKLGSITGSVIPNRDIGYTFSPTVEALKKTLYEIWRDGRVVLEKKGQFARTRALQFFTAKKMIAAYERLFLCIALNREERNGFCIYNHNFEGD